MKFIRIFLFILIVIGIGLLFTQRFWVPKLVTMILVSEENPKGQVTEAQTENTILPISIGTQKITEQNFTGTVAKISGSSKVAGYAQEYIDKAVFDFEKQADAEVPPMVAKFGAGSPPATYEIDIDAKYVKSAKTESVVISTYTFTGGAHGVTAYKVITTPIASGTNSSRMLSLYDIINTGQEKAFLAFVKTQLDSWIPDGSDTPPVFTDEVSALTFADLANWSLDDQNLTIYFDQGSIGPDVLGAIAFPLPVLKISDFLDLTKI